MASTNFQDYNQNTPIVAAWLNDINKGIYSPMGVAKLASQISSAWVRFSATGGIVVIQQSMNILSVVRNSQGVFTVTYVTPLTNATNCYDITQNVPGFVSFGAETTSSVIINTNNTFNVATDPGACSVVIYGAN